MFTFLLLLIVDVWFNCVHLIGYVHSHWTYSIIRFQSFFSAATKIWRSLNGIFRWYTPMWYLCSSCRQYWCISVHHQKCKPLIYVCLLLCMTVACCGFRVSRPSSFLCPHTPSRYDYIQTLRQGHTENLQKWRKRSESERRHNEKMADAHPPTSSQYVDHTPWCRHRATFGIQRFDSFPMNFEVINVKKLNLKLSVSTKCITK